MRVVFDTNVLIAAFLSEGVCSKLLVREASGEILQDVNPIQPLCGDPNDDKILFCAKEAKADYLVTGDQDLLVLSRYENTRIVTPRNFEALFPD